MVKGPGWNGPIHKYPLKSRWNSWWPSELERREAARFAGLTWAEFDRLPGIREVADQLGYGDCKCDVIAHYRMSKLYEAVMADLAEKHPPPKPPKKKKSG